MSRGHIGLLSIVLAAANPAVSSGSFTVTPYVQHPASDAMTIIFFTDSEGTATVSCNGKSQTTTGEKATELVKVASDDKANWGTQYRHRVRLTDLRPNTAYQYTVELSGGESYENEFRTAPADLDTPVRFVAYSDSETIPPTFRDSSAENGCTKEWDVLVNGVNQVKTYPVSRSVGFASNLLHMASWKPDFYVIAGDLAARGGVQLFWDEFWKENAGGLGRGYGDPAGSAPILATMGNHDHYDNKNFTALSYNTSSDEIGLKKYLTYFEFNPNGVDYASVSAGTERDARDKSQLFHREDYGPVTLLFLDTNRGGSSNSKSRVPSFDEGSLQYRWIEANLKDARDVRHSRFIFVVSHQDPYSCGKHNAPNDGQSTANVRAQLTGLMHRYGVTAWLAGHDEMQEHAQVAGTETLADGSTRPHTMNVYDLGSAGDGLKGVRKYLDNEKYIVFAAYSDSPDGTHYGHLQVEVAPSNGVWYCTMTPAYSYFKDSTSPSELRYYKDKIVIREGGEIVYEERLGPVVPPEEPDEPEEPEEPDEPPVEDHRSEPTDVPIATNALELAVGVSTNFSFHNGNLRYWLLGSTNDFTVVRAEPQDLAMVETDAYAGYSLRSAAAVRDVTVTLTALKPGQERIFLARQTGTYQPGSGSRYFAIEQLFVVTVSAAAPVIPALPPLTDEEKSRIAEILSSSPDRQLKKNVTEVKDYMAYRTWVDKGVKAGTIDSQATAKGAVGSFFSFATDQDRIVDPAVISDDKVEVKEVEVDNGGVRLTVGIDGVPVGEHAQAEYLERVFGVVGSETPGEDFAADKVKYGEMKNNGDGTVSCTAEPTVEPKPAAFFFKATVAQ